MAQSDQSLNAIAGALRVAMEQHQAGRFAEAEGSYRQVLAIDPDHAVAHDNLGHVLIALGRGNDAESHYRRALRLGHASYVTYNNLGNVLQHSGRTDEAVHSYRRALALHTGTPDVHLNLAIALQRLGRLAEAEDSYRNALAIDPNIARAHNDLGALLTGLRRIDEAEICYRRALEVEPRFAEAHDNLGYLIGYTARLHEAIQHFRDALALKPDFVKAYDHLLFSLNYVPGLGPAEIYAEHREFNRRFCQNTDIRPHRNRPRPERRLRVGYVSGDFCSHAVAMFIEPVLARHDEMQFEILCYYNSTRSDAATQRLRSHAHHWREVESLGDDAFADLVRADEIDILVDLSGHTERNRLTAFARKPAPVQATWLGYLNTTGLDAMDYRICDPRACPDGLLEAYHSEKLVRLPDSQWCYGPPADCPEVNPLPSAGSGVVTFGAFTSPPKTGLPVIELWSRLLARVPKSRLLVQIGGVDSIPNGYAELFWRNGIARERADFVSAKPLRDYLALRHAVDIVLDTFPCTGGTTSCDSLWMGVPVITLVGDTAYSRGGASLLHAVGLGELIARSPEEFLEIGTRLACNTPRLAAMRAGLRERMRHSPLVDSAQFTRNLEKAYRDMWRAWCAAQPS
jgi:protein O-GlcNAc transferase